MATDYQQLAKNVADASKAFESATDIVERLEHALFTMEGRVEAASKKYAEAEYSVASAQASLQRAIDLGKTGSALNPSLERLKKATDTRDQAGRQLEETKGQAGLTAKDLSRAENQQDEAGKALAGAQDAIPGPVGQAMDGVTASLVAFKDSLQAVVPLMGQMGGALGQFVGALSPALMEQFSRAMKDLNAVIGQALAPVMGVLVDVVQQVADVLNPIMKQLQPIFADLAQAIAGLLMPIIENAAAAFTALIPVIKLVADVLVGLTPILRVFSVLQAGLVEFFTGLMSSLTGSVDMKGAMASFKSAMEDVAKVMIRAAAHIARAFGALGFIDGMIKGITRKSAEKVTARGMAAPESVGITDLAGYSSQMLTAAFAATDMGGKKKDTDDWLKDIVDDLKDIKEGPAKLWDLIDALPKKFAEALMVVVREGIPGVPTHVAEGGRFGWAGGFGGVGGAAAGSLAAWLRGK